MCLVDCSLSFLLDPWDPSAAPLAKLSFFYDHMMTMNCFSMVTVVSWVSVTKNRADAYLHDPNIYSLCFGRCKARESENLCWCPWNCGSPPEDLQSFLSFRRSSSTASPCISSTLHTWYIVTLIQLLSHSWQPSGPVKQSALLNKTKSKVLVHASSQWNRMRKYMLYKLIWYYIQT